MNKYVLFLDDEREPSISLLARYERVIVCRTYNEAVETVTERGMPEHICFDHDLGSDSKSGYDFAKWLVDLCVNEDWFAWPQRIEYSIHSQNPIGSANIKGLLDNYHTWLANSLKL